MKIKILAVAFASALIAFTIFAVLDTFVISRVYQTDISDMDTFRQREASLEVNNAELENTDTEDILPPDNTTVNTDQTLQDTAQEDVIQQDDIEDDTDSRGDWASSFDNNGDSNVWGNRSSDSDNNGDSNNWENWDDSSNDAAENSENWWFSSSYDDGDSGNWDWETDSDDDEPMEIDVTKEEALEYMDDNIQITISLYEVSDSTVYVADIRLSSAEYLKSAFAQDSYGRNVTDEASDIAASHSAILAINGDYYGAREKGYVIRNGIVYRDTVDDADVLCIYADGSMTIVDPSEITAQELVDQGVWQAYSFGPALVIDGEIEATSNNTTNSRWRWGWGSTTSNNPRTAIGIYEPLHYLFVVSDGRTNSSEGLTLDELAEFMQSLGVTTAYNLDGGGSSTMVFQDEVVNRPTTYGAIIDERDISDIIYIG